MTFRPFVYWLFSVALAWAGWPAVDAAPVPVADDRTASAALARQARSGQSVYLAKLAGVDGGTLFTGAAARELPPGRYRLHAEVAVAPLGNLVVGLVELRLQAGSARRSFSVVHFPRDDEFVNLWLDFTLAEGQKVPVAVTWAAVEPPKAKGLVAKRALEAEQAVPTSLSPAAQKPGELNLFDDLGQGAQLELDDETSTFTLAEAKATPYRLVLAGVHLERLSPVEIQVRTDKVCYVPGEPGKVSIRFLNRSDLAVEVRPVVHLRWRLDQALELPCEAVLVPAQGEQNAELDFATQDLYWGAEIQVRAVVADEVEGEGRGVFAVRRNLWETAITGTAPEGMWSAADPQAAQAAATKLRDNGFTGFEAFFWGPCDMLDFTPETERWYSGQTAYPFSQSGTRSIIEAGHQQGLFATVYANLWGGSGPPAMELWRRHPEWFSGGNFNTFVLDDWDLLGPWQDMQGARLRAPGVAAWCFNQLFIAPLDEIFRHHARELIGTHRQFGWDGVRYDSYYSRYWSVKAMRLIRAAVAAELPEFQFGYNSFAHHDANALALDDMVGGGGMIMAEGIRLERIRQITPFVQDMLSWREIIWAYGGHGPGMIFRNSTDEEQMTPIGIEYQASGILAAGGHFYYQLPASERADYAQFALRYSEYIYNNRMRPLTAPETVVSFGQEVKWLEWPRLARTLTLAGGRQRLVLHLINPPLDEEPFKNKAMRAPQPLRAIPLSIRLPADARVAGLWELHAAPAAHHRPIPYAVDQGQVAFVLPEVRFWTAIVLDYDSSTPLPSPVTLKEKTDTYIQDWYILGPFANDQQMSAVGTPYPPEEKVDLAASYAGKDGQEIRWRRLLEPGHVPPPGRPVDFKQELGDDRNFAAGYLYTEITSDREREAALWGRADDTIAIWVNGEPAPFVGGTGEFQGVDEGRAAIRLQAGRNTVLVKVCEKWLYWLLALRLADADGVPLTEADGLTVGGPRN